VRAGSASEAVEAFFAEAARKACPAFIRKGAAKAVAYFLHQSEDKAVGRIVSAVCATRGFQSARVHRQLSVYLRGIAKERRAIAVVLVVADGIVQYPRLTDVEGAGGNAENANGNADAAIGVAGARPLTAAVVQFEAPGFRKVLHLQASANGALEFEPLPSEGNALVPLLFD